MTRRIGIALAATFLVVLLVPAAPAVAGGGCHTGPTQGEGDTVELKDACFTPSNLSIDPGESVTFVNLDDITHNVGGGGWGTSRTCVAGRHLHGHVRRGRDLPARLLVPPGHDRRGHRRRRHRRGETARPSRSMRSNSPNRRPWSRWTVSEPSSGTTVAIGWLAGAVIGVALGFGIAALVRRNAWPIA